MDRRERLAFAIATAMRRQGLTPPKLAAKLGKSKETVRRWRDGDAVPSMLEVAPLAEALGVNPIYLINPPEVPEYPLDEYLVRETVDHAVEEAAAEDRQRPPRAGE
jgi:ribosome-binding protein aMBF1 (putative translation factor)